MSDAKDQNDAATPKKGGFGAFSQNYRDRWAAGHPNAKQPAASGNPQAAPTSDPAPDAPSDDASAPDADTKA